MPRQRLAKLTPPRLHGAVGRERLFALLDRKREHPVVWVAGPPGSGKTTLVASYLVASRSPAIWYLLDRGDSDPATFFYYLAQAARAASRSRGKSLPLLTPEYLPDLEGFSRRFFRDVFGRLPEGALLVLDNYQEIAADSALHRMLNAAIAEVPQSANLLVISRAPPPGLFVRAQVAGSLDMLGWEELRLAPDETAAIVARRETPDPKVVAAIHARSGGWVAGVRLLLQAETSLRSDVLSTGPEGLESTFDYFATEFFDAAPELLRLVLLRTASFPRFTVEMAVAITGDPHAGEQIEQLYKRRLFIDRRLGNEATYQYRDLFRAFLRNRADQRLPPEEIASLTAQSAALLRAANLADEAFGLFVQAKDWARAEEIFLDQAPRLISSGRWLTLDDWADSLPKERLEGNPWLLYWLGRSKALVDPVQAFPILELAYESFTKRGDNLGQLLCAAEVVETLHFAVARFEAMGLWLERMELSLGAQKSPLQTDDELRVHSTLFWAAENSDPCSPVIASSVARVQELLPCCTDVNLRISVANMLHYHSVRSADSQTAQIAMREARPFLDSPALSADRLALYFLAEGMAHVDPGRYADALACYDRADAVIEAHGLAGRDHIAGVWRAMCQYAAGDVQNSHATLARVETLRSEDLPVIAQVLLNARAWVAFSRDEIESALKHVQAAVENIDKWGPSIVQGWNLPNQAYMQISAGHVLQAREPLKKIRSQSWLDCYGHFRGTVALLEAWEALRTGQESRCHDALQECLRLAQDERDRMRMRWYPKAMAELLPIALEQDIETETARTLIRECRLDPPAHMSDAWPWPVKVNTLGRFEILIDGKRLEFGRKIPKRTLALLKALIALGGTDVPEQKLIDSLWPDQEADAAVESLAAALHRLRRLLGGNNLIRQGGGLLSLNGKRVFVDVWAFEAGTDDRAKRGLALRLYRGNFLHGDSEPWAASLRERLRGKFVRMVESVSSDLESSGQWQEAIELYVRGIGTDDLIEPFYRGLMRCYSNLGRATEAAGAYRRLRQTLSVTLGTKPSAESQRLFETLRLQ